MTELARKILDELLGPDRNKPASQRGTGGVKFYDSNVCRLYLVDFCPYETFLNTKSDLGCCPKRYHEESLRDRFQSPEGDPYREEFEREFYQTAEKLVGDLERRLRRGRDRVDPSNTARDHLSGIIDGPAIIANPVNDEIEEKRTILELQLREKLAQVEEAGEQGRLQEAQRLMNEIDAVKADLEALRRQEQDNPMYRLEKRMEVCPTCGAFLIVGDAQKRIEAHYEGRQHTGWAKVRLALETLRPKYGGGGGSHGDLGGKRRGDYNRVNRSSEQYPPRDYHHRERPPQRHREREDPPHYRDPSRREDYHHHHPPQEQHYHRSNRPPVSAGEREPGEVVTSNNSHNSYYGYRGSSPPRRR